MYRTNKNPMNECCAACFILWAATQLDHTLRPLTSAQYMPSTFLTFGHTWKYMKQAALTLVGSRRLAAKLAAEYSASTYMAQVPEAEILGKLCLWQGSGRWSLNGLALPRLAG